VHYVRKVVGRRFLGVYRFVVRAEGKAFSLACAGAFHSFGHHTVIQPPLRLSGERRIAVGDNVSVGPRCWFQVLGGGDGVAITIGSGTGVVGDCVLSAASSITIGKQVLFARGIYVSDHSHAFDDPTTAIRDQGIDKIAPVVIEDGAWLGENVVVCPGVTIGRGAVVGANSVVVSDVPARSVAVGAPATVIRRLEVVPPAASR
jgi:acetyltransferase-like isoleucine patch superfamily enzyme